MTDTKETTMNIEERLASAGIEIKPLDWHHFDSWTWWAESVCGTFYLEERNGFWIAGVRFRDANHIIYEIDDFETAHIAVQADYTARILATLQVKS